MNHAAGCAQQQPAAQIVPIRRVRKFRHVGNFHVGLMFLGRNKLRHSATAGKELSCEQ